MLNAKEVPFSGKDNAKAPLLEPGAYPARLVKVINMGMQPQRPHEGKEKAPQMELDTTYELLDEFMLDDDGNEDKKKPRWFSENFPFFPLRSDRANSTKRYYALDPAGKFEGDWTKLLGTPCIVNIIKNPSKKDDRVFNNIYNVSSMRGKDADKAPALVNPTIVWDFYEPDLEIFNKFPDWMKEKIKGAVDYKGGKLESLLTGGGVASATTDPLQIVRDEEEGVQW